jgi:hypothetical protein
LSLPAIKTEPEPEPESELDALFKRLNAPSAPTPAASTLSAGPDTSKFSFGSDDTPKGLTAADVLKSYTGKVSAAKSTPPLPSPSPAPKKENQANTTVQPAEKGKSEKDLEHEYVFPVYKMCRNL